VAPLRWEAAVVEERLGVAVRSLIVIHGPSAARRGLGIRGRRVGGVRVVPAAGLVRRIRRGRRRLRRDDVTELAARCASVFAPAQPPPARSPPRGRGAPPAASWQDASP
jgi:hypothetical protein